MSIEFFKPKFRPNGRIKRNRIKADIYVPQDVHGVVPFVVNSYDYTPENLEKEDIEKIYDAILSWINGGLNAEYIDPFANTFKEAKVKSKIANITWNIALNISVDKDGIYVSVNGCGADFIPENKNINYRNMNKKLIRLTESDLHRIVRESVNKVLNEHYLAKGVVEEWEKVMQKMRELWMLDMSFSINTMMQQMVRQMRLHVTYMTNLQQLGKVALWIKTLIF